MDIQKNKKRAKGKAIRITEQISKISSSKHPNNNIKIDLLFTYFDECGDDFNAINLSCLLDNLSGLIKERLTADTSKQIAKIVARIPDFESTSRKSLYHKISPSSPSFVKSIYFIKIFYHLI
jgi:hypothetical protein